MYGVALRAQGTGHRSKDILHLGVFVINLYNYYCYRLLVKVAIIFKFSRSH